MKKVILYTTLLLAVLFPAAALAADFTSPAELLSVLTGKPVQEIQEKRQQDVTYGQIAQEYGVLENFKSEQLELKKKIIEERVKAGLITEENGEALKKMMEERIQNCDGSLGQNGQKLGQQFQGGLGFDRGSGKAMGQGRGAGKGIGMGRVK